MTQRIPQCILNAHTSADTSNPYALDYRFDQNATHSIAGTLTAGDTIILLVSPNTAQQITDGLPDVFVTAATYTSATFADVFHGSWPRVKIQKTGTAGAASVYVV